jgi:hypothetical protein
MPDFRLRSKMYFRLGYRFLSNLKNVAPSGAKDLYGLYLLVCRPVPAYRRASFTFSPHHLSFFVVQPYRASGSGCPSLRLALSGCRYHSKTGRRLVNGLPPNFIPVLIAFLLVGFVGYLLISYRLNDIGRKLIRPPAPPEKIFTHTFDQEIQLPQPTNYLAVTYAVQFPEDENDPHKIGLIQIAIKAAAVKACAVHLRAPTLADIKQKGASALLPPEAMHLAIDQAVHEAAQHENIFATVKVRIISYEVRVRQNVAPNHDAINI